MTREEAQRILATWLVSSKGADGQRGYIEGWFDEDDAEAFRMAIEALLKTKTGHVETANNGNPLTPTVWAVCSECRKPIDPWDKYCRSCGAKMGGDSE